MRLALWLAWDGGAHDIYLWEAGTLTHVLGTGDDLDDGVVSRLQIPKRTITAGPWITVRFWFIVNTFPVFLERVIF